jgi:hypothetical protein
VAKWDGVNWTELIGTNSLNAIGTIFSICSDKYGNIYAAGNFKDKNNAYMYVAKWNGSNWNELDGNSNLQANDIIFNLCSDKAGNIYAAGDFKDGSSVNPIYNRYVAKWTNTNTSIIGLSNIDYQTFIYPNPTQNSINIKSAEDAISSNYCLYNAIGQMILSGTILSETTEINLDHLCKGVYFLNIGNNNTQSFKVIKD